MATHVLATMIDFARAGHGFRLRLEFKPADLWVGMYWDVSTFSDMPSREAPQVDMWLCVLPMLPIHLTFRKRFVPLAPDRRPHYVNLMSLRETFGKRFSEIRKRKGWSMAETGRRFDPPVAPTYIFQLEHGLDNPTLDQVERVAAVLGVRPQRLLSPTDKP